VVVHHFALTLRPFRKGKNKPFSDSSNPLSDLYLAKPFSITLSDLYLANPFSSWYWPFICRSMGVKACAASSDMFLKPNTIKQRYLCNLINLTWPAIWVGHNSCQSCNCHFRFPAGIYWSTVC